MFIFLFVACLAAPAPAASTLSFKRDIAPVLVESCIACHNPKVKKGRYDMSRIDRLVKGGGKGAAIVPGKSASSLVSLMMHGDEEPAMPKDADLLPAAVLARIDRWIDEGAKFDVEPTVDLRDLAPAKSAGAARVYPHAIPISALAFDPAGKLLAASGYREITLWDPETSKLVGRLPVEFERIHALEFSPDGKSLLAAGGTPGKVGEVLLFDVSARKPVRSLARLEDEILAATFSPDGAKIAAGGVDRTFRIWDLAGKELAKVENHADWVLALAFSADGKQLFSASRDKSVKMWDVVQREPVLTFSGHTDGVMGIALVPEDKLVASVGADNHLRIWTAAGDAPQKADVAAHTNTVFAIRLLRRSGQFVTAGGDNAVRIWKSVDGSAVATLSGHSDCVYSLAVSPGEKWLASGSWDGQIRIWDLATKKSIREFIAVPPSDVARK